MGNKHRLLPWIHSITSEFDFITVLDAFSGAGSVSYMLKTMGKEVTSNDFLTFSSIIAKAAIENSSEHLTEEHLDLLQMNNPNKEHFIERKFRKIFYTQDDLQFLDNIWANLESLPADQHKSIALSALFRACLKRQPRGVFTVSGKDGKYDDGRRDLKLTIQEHFLESVSIFNGLVFDNSKHNTALNSDVFAIDRSSFDLVYLDPPYIPRSDDNCYIKRYHFLEGLATYWRSENSEIMESSKVKKIKKRYTPFSYRRECRTTFESLFQKFEESIIVLSYSSNGYPDLEMLCEIMREFKEDVTVHKKLHRYHFGNHAGVSKTRSAVEEYLIVGS